MTGQPDPHLEWEQLLRTLQDDELYAIEDKIAQTPATTLGGAAVQLRLVLSYIEIGSGTTTDCAVDALKNAIATLERLEAAP